MKTLLLLPSSSLKLEAYKKPQGWEGSSLKISQLALDHWISNLAAHLESHGGVFRNAEALGVTFRDSGLLGNGWLGRVTRQFNSTEKFKSYYTRPVVLKM